MKFFFSLAGTALLLAACNSNESTGSAAQEATAEIQAESEWISLFDGESTAGWHTYGKETVGSAWKAKDGLLYLEVSDKEGWQSQNGGDLVSDEEFEDFHLKMDWKISENGNSGLIFYIHEDTSRFPYPWHTGMEMQVLHNEGHPDGKIQKHRVGDLYDLIEASPEAAKPVGEWNHVEIISRDGKLEFFLNEKNVVSTTLWDDTWKALIANSKFSEMPGFGTYKKGRIALQDHGDPVWFKNIMIKRL